jgi:hypothetical protein
VNHHPGIAVDLAWIGGVIFGAIPSSKGWKIWIDSAISLAFLFAMLTLAGCLDGNSGITSSGTDGHQETHIPVGDPKQGCYLIVGESPVVTHCPSIAGVP